MDTSVLKHLFPGRVPSWGNLVAGAGGDARANEHKTWSMRAPQLFHTPGHMWFVHTTHGNTTAVLVYVKLERFGCKGWRTEMHQANQFSSSNQQQQTRTETTVRNAAAKVCARKLMRDRSSHATSACSKLTTRLPATRPRKTTVKFH